MDELVLKSRGNKFQMNETKCKELQIRFAKSKPEFEPKERNLKKLHSVQNFESHIIDGLQKYDHMTPILKELNWIPVKKQLFYRDAVFAFKCMKGMAPSYLSSQFTTRGIISGRTTRQSDHLNIPLFTSATGQKSFQYRIVKLWNDLPLKLKLKLCDTIASFKINLRKNLLSKFLNNM